jgi:hypothetical protein
MRSPLAGAIALFLAACGGAQDRPEPPSGAVDPGVHGLVSPGESRSAPPAASPADPAPAALGGIPGALPALPGAMPPAAPAAPRTGEATGAITMTREHCATLGRKFAELVMAQGGAPDASPTREAEEMGKSFADRCAHDMVGQTVDVREYQCMLRAKAAGELLGCKR